MLQPEPRNSLGVPKNATQRHLRAVSRNDVLTYDGIPVYPIFGSSGSATNGQLYPEHLDMLARSGISPEFAAQRGYETVMNATCLKALGLAKAAQKLVPGVMFPLWRADLSLAGWQYRPDNPRILRGKTAKYEMPMGQCNVIDVPPGVGDWLSDVEQPLWITEGTKKADCGAQRGLCIVAINGVYGWVAKGGVALPDWRDIALQGRRVILAFDSDVSRKPQVGRALRELAAWLGSKGAHVEYLQLPDNGDEKVGLDDYLVDGHSIADLYSLVTSDDGQSSKSTKAADRIVDLALADYRLGITPDGDAFGYLPAVPHVAMKLRSKKLGLRPILARAYYRKYDTVAQTSAVLAACDVLEGIARELVPTPLHLRVAGAATAIRIDMADDDNRVIEIRDGSWSIVDQSDEFGESPFMFRRTELTAAMPEPKRWGDDLRSGISKLWTYLNIQEEDRRLALAIVVDALINPDTAKPITGFTGEHGTAKTASAKRFITLFDPSNADLHSPPKDLEHWNDLRSGKLVGRTGQSVQYLRLVIGCSLPRIDGRRHSETRALHRQRFSAHEISSMRGFERDSFRRFER